MDCMTYCRHMRAHSVGIYHWTRGMWLHSSTYLASQRNDKFCFCFLLKRNNLISSQIMQLRTTCKKIWWRKHFISTYLHVSRWGKTALCQEQALGNLKSVPCSCRNSSQDRSYGHHGVVLIFLLTPRNLASKFLGKATFLSYQDNFFFCLSKDIISY